MKYIKRDLYGNVEAASEIKFDDTYELANEEYDVGFDGKLYSASEMNKTDYLTRKAEFNNNIRLSAIRAQRETECFPIINRGALWYDKLTAEQKAELAVWYQEWLDAPQTGVIPTKPTWIDKV